MGTTSDETEREINQIRFETEEIMSELGRRARTAADVREQARLHPWVTAGITVASSLALAALGYSIYHRVTTKKPVVEKLEERVVEPIRIRAEKFTHPVRIERRDDSMVKKVIWVGLASATAALASIMARRAVEAGWRRVMHEEPPE